MRQALAAVIALGMASIAHAAAPAADDALKAAIASDQRTPAYVQRDAARHPYGTLSFFGIQPNMTVVELSPGGGWYTEILAPYLRDAGRYIAAAYGEDSPKEYRRGYTANFKKKLAADPTRFGKVQLTVFEPPSNLSYAPPGSADLVLTFRNLHNWLSYGDDNMKRVFQSVYDTLKPGGVFGVVEHRLPENMKQDATASSGYMHESYVIEMAESVGFKLAAKSEINANPKDTADHPNGVWALPPTYRNKDKDRARYEAIGESDRMTLKFVKP
ncbi:class I SAM-dependent methyltransferase [Pusillimonas noertemannii]|uniref:Putative methyltransferase n=1 Tax=Pusillimonas noertemannii TaxID=305977 RepID=A0A2U1CNS7_9BURK|nr:class I SAM-dependent methyltransferase [Pusillimonas noertemannii]PVY62594.1 putative methyltransferase [Pusillimonas noertemannii]TFL10459.1 methyltransferase [Pusillimonas noertemannii]